MTQILDESENNPSPAEPELLDLTRFPEAHRSTFRVADNTPTYIVPAAQIIDVLRFLRDEGRFTMLEDVTAIDWYPREPRFQVVYNMIAIERAKVICLKVELPGEQPSIASLTGLFPGANWYEREVFDLFGINFENHPDMRRIEMPEDWEGHPLRKDYPVTGPRRANLPANWRRNDGRTE